MAKVKITQREEGMQIWLDDAKEPYNVGDWAVRQEAGRKPMLTFILPVTVEVDSLVVEGLENSEENVEPETAEVQWVKP